MDDTILVPRTWNITLGNIIKVIGVGGGGNNAVGNMYEKGITGVDFIVCNTDNQVLDKSPVPTKIQIGKRLTDGLGTGCDPDKGREAALENLDEIKEILSQNTKMVFITAGLGGGTGTGAAPIIAKEAKDMGILTVAIVTLPFKDEGEDPYKRAMDGLFKLRQHVDSLLIINSQKLYDIYSDLSVFDAFPKADDIVATAAKSIAELITIRGYINVDFADVQMVMTNGGMALMGLGKGKGEDRVQTAVDQALKSPLLDNNDISDAKRILVNISSGKKNPLKMQEMGCLMEYINEASGRKANFKRGVSLDLSLDEESSDAEIVVTIIATGFSMDNSFPVEPLEGEDKPLEKVDEPLEGNDEPVDEDNEPFDESENEDTEIKTETTVFPSVQRSQRLSSVKNTPNTKKSEKGTACGRAGVDIIIEAPATKNVTKHRLEEYNNSHNRGRNSSSFDKDITD
jgi:cell division protein FtsZ